VKRWASDGLFRSLAHRHVAEFNRTLASDKYSQVIQSQLCSPLLFIEVGSSGLKTEIRTEDYLRIRRYLFYGQNETFGEGNVSLVAAHEKLDTPR